MASSRGISAKNSQKDFFPISTPHKKKHFSDGKHTWNSSERKTKSYKLFPTAGCRANTWRQRQQKKKVQGHLNSYLVACSRWLKWWQQSRPVWTEFFFLPLLETSSTSLRSLGSKQLSNEAYNGRGVCPCLRLVWPRWRASPFDQSDVVGVGYSGGWKYFHIQKSYLCNFFELDFSLVPH